MSNVMRCSVMAKRLCPRCLVFFNFTTELFELLRITDNTNTTSDYVECFSRPPSPCQKSCDCKCEFCLIWFQFSGRTQSLLSKGIFTTLGCQKATQQR